MWILRELSTYLKKISTQRPAIVISGCRQAGKTSLLEMTFPKAHYVTLDLPLEAAQAEEAGDSFLQTHPPPLIIDEVQYAPGLLRYLKYRIDQNRQSMGQYFLTGSQKFQLMEKITESLAGRIAVLDCYSLAAIEYERHIGQKLEGDKLWQWIWTGGYPEIHAHQLDPRRYYADYLVTYLERDVRQILQVRNLRDFEKFLRLCATRTGQLLSYHSLAGDLGISPATLKTWFNVLESSNIIYLLEPYYQNLGKRLVKTPKLYFVDSGLAAYLAGFQNFEELRKSAIAGAFFETHVLGQLLRYFGNRGQRPNLYFYRDHQGKEVDFVIPVGQSLHLLECKLSESFNPAIAGFEEITRLLGEKKILSKNLITPQRQTRKFSEKFWMRNSIDFGDMEI